MAAAAVVLGRPRLLRMAQWLAGRTRRLSGMARRLPLGRSWSSSRDVPTPPAQSFRAWLRVQHRRSR
jgi:L-lactate dehydrogenase complex protein LldF